MISLPTGTKIWLVAGITDMRNGFNGLCLLTKRLERGRFAWPSTRDGKVFLTPAQLAMLVEGIDWRHPKRLLNSLTML
ncbi:IS66 family insertion sequence element accessory protein TnpB [Serratia sp. OS31]|uniref:IS66 family insertion sequence element accessory protein TnpB n=1 Tax=Serratia sp. OS31 TaxID=2760844 RepID=UPI0016001759|nr:IS66 family insertion sequence element accessory protein TnpB [Serratia sp. OS31]MBB1585099.1 IS66 family insertion sequence element accessory protein TnpB [Serratia sp. OS31]